MYIPARSPSSSEAGAQLSSRAPSRAAPSSVGTQISRAAHDDEQLSCSTDTGEHQQDARLSQHTGVNPDAVFLKLQWRIVPIFWLMVVLNYIDRTNLAFAAIQLTRDLGFDSAVYGLGSGLFFATYATLQVPSNIILRHVGGPRWLAAIIAAWGTCAVGFAFMRTKTHFFVLRTLLGVAEAGAFPGMWFMIGRFFPPSRITLVFALVESGITLSHTIAPPLAAGLLTLNGAWGLQGWQWLFLLEGLPSLLLAVVVWRLLPASPKQATMLTDPERAYLVAKMKAVRLAAGGARKVSNEDGGGSGDDVDSSDASASDSDYDDLEMVPLKGTVQEQPHGPNGWSKVTQPTAAAGLAVAELQTPFGTANTVASAALGLPSKPAVIPPARRSQPSAAARTAGRWSGWAAEALSRVLTQEVVTALGAAVRNKYVWYLGATKMLKDIAGYGVIFFTPMIVHALIQGDGAVLGAVPAPRPPPPAPAPPSRGLQSWAQGLTAAAAAGRQLQGAGAVPAGSGDIGTTAALLTSVPFGLAAASMMYVAHRSQAEGERIFYIGAPALVAGVLFTLFPLLARVSTLAAFVCLCVSVVGINCVSAPNLALLSELAAGPGLVVALPLYNSIGNVGGFLGPAIIGWMLRATHSFAWPSVMMGTCLAVSGVGVLVMPWLLGLPSGVGGPPKG